MAEDGWDGPAKSKLWRYNQHYFDDLNAANSTARAEWHNALITNWVAANPPGMGSGWEPYPTSLRIVNWVKWALSGNTLPEGARQSLAVQARWLSRRLEHHLLGNHLFANAKALCFAGFFFDSPEARIWLSKGTQILEREIPEQILADGGQFELSPMYHALALEDLLDLVNLAQAYDREDLARAWAEPVPAMFDWLTAMSHPDGGVAFFNDAAFGIAPENSELTDYAQRLGLGSQTKPRPLVNLKDSGYVRLHSGPSVLIADIARVGPDYLPGHAHADTLSFEFSLFGGRVIVNSGTSLYGVCEERARQRGTSAHSTVTVSGRSSSEVWSGFRVGARARVLRASVAADGDRLIAEGAHDGYRDLPGRPVHARRWELSSTALRVFDSVQPGYHPAAARFYFHPDIIAEQGGRSDGALILPGGRRVLWRTQGGNSRLEKSSWHPEFGKKVENTCLVLSLEQGASVFELTWS